MNQAELTRADLNLIRDDVAQPASSLRMRRADRNQLLMVWGAVIVAFGLVMAGGAQAAGFWYFMVSVAAAALRPSLGLALILAGVPLTHNVSPGGGNLSIAEVALLVMGTAAMFTGRARVGKLIMPIAAYLIICLLSSALSYHGQAAVMSWLQMVIYFIFTLLAFTAFGRNSNAVVLALTAMCGTSFMLAIGQIAQGGGGGFVFNIHKNSIGATMAASLVVAVELWFRAGFSKDRRRIKIWLGVIAVLALATLLSLSRGAWGSAVIGIFIVIAIRGRWGLILKFSAVMIPVAIIGLLLLPESSREYIASSVDTESHSFGTRADNIEVAKYYFEQNKLLGSGLGLRKTYDATNIVWLTLAETGVIGLLAFAWVKFAAVKLAWTNRRKLDPRSPAFSILALSAALLIGRLGHGMVDHYWSRGAITVAWSMVGAMMMLHYQLRSKQLNEAVK